jgi:tRNA splicing ligase
VVKEIDYSKLNQKDLVEQFEIEKKNWASLPRKSSFSGLAISGRLDKIQQIMKSRGYDFEPIYMEINMLD